MRGALTIGLGVLAVLALWLLPDWEVSRRSAPLLDDAPQGDAAPPPLLTASGKKERARRSQPGLAPRVIPGATKDAARGPVTITVIGPDDAPLPGLFVGLIATASKGQGSTPANPPCVEGPVLETDGRGQVLYRDLPHDGSVSARLFRGDPRSPEAERAEEIELHGAGGFQRAVRGARLVLRAAVGLWLEVLVVAAEDGTPLPGARVTMPGVHATADGGRRHLVMLAPTYERQLALKIDAPDGWIAWDTPPGKVTLSPYAKRLVVSYPLRREVEVVLTVFESDGRPAHAAEIPHLQVAGRSVSRPRYATDTFGRLRILGVPFLPGEPLTLRARRPGGAVSATVEGRLPESPDLALSLEVRLPKPNLIGIGGGAGGAFGGRRGSRRMLTGGGGRARGPKGDVSVRVVRHDGTPAQGALVYFGPLTKRTDARGRAWFPQVSPGNHAVRVKQVGLLPLSGSVRVKAGQTVGLALQEGPGSRLHVEVVDQEGRPLSYARLKLTTPSGLPWIDLAQGTQRLDPYTDHRGRRALHGVEPGPVTVYATWGSRAKQVKVQAVSDEDLPVRIVLPRP